MMHQGEKPPTRRIDYHNLHADRRKLSNYLRTGYFKKIAGRPIVNYHISRRRLWLLLAAAIILVIGIGGVLGFW